MVRVIMGAKGTGKTKQLIDMINHAADNEGGSVVCVEIGKKLVETFTSPDFKIDGITGSAMTWSKEGEISKEPKGMVIKDGVYVGM